MAEVGKADLAAIRTQIKQIEQRVKAGEIDSDMNVALIKMYLDQALPEDDKRDIESMLGKIRELKQQRDGQEKPQFGLERQVHVLGEHDPNDVKEGDYAVRDGKTYKFQEGNWVPIDTQ